MGQLFPTIYFTFDGFQRRQLKQDLLRAFNQSRLNELGFKVQFSPRTVVDFGVPDGLTVIQQCQHAALVVALLEPSPGHGSRQNMLNTELSYALESIGTEVAVLSEVESPEIPSQLLRQLELHQVEPHHINSEPLAEKIWAQLDSQMLGTTAPLQLDILPADYCIHGAALDAPKSQLDTMPAPQLIAQLYAQAPEVANGSPALADLQQHRLWGIQNLILDNPSGAMNNIQQCLALNDCDLMANYWRCRLLADKAEKESEFQELIQRSNLLMKQLSQHQSDFQLCAQCQYFLSLGYAGLKRYDESLVAIQASLEYQQSTAWHHQVALRALQLLSHQDAPPERLDPALNAAKNCFLKLLSLSLEGYQLSFRQLLLKTPKEKLEIVMLGVKQVVIASLKQIKQHEQQLLDQCAECEIIVPTQLDSELINEAMSKSIWNLLAIGRDSVEQQITLMQLLAQQLTQVQAEASELESTANQQDIQQQRLSDDIGKQQHRFQDITSAKKLSIIGSSVALALCAVLVSGYWWLPLTSLVISILLAGSVAALALLLILLSRQLSVLEHIQQRCRELDSLYAISDDELPEPRAMEGWFDRLTVRRDKLKEKQHLLQQKCSALSQKLQPRLEQFVSLQQSFAEQVLLQLDGAFIHSTQTDNTTDYHITDNNQQFQLPEELAQQLAEQPVPAINLQLAQHTSNADIYFAQPPSSKRLRSLNLLQTAANTESMVTIVRAPVVSTQEPLSLNKWLVSTGDSVSSDQAIAELQNSVCSIPLLAPVAGFITKQLVTEGNDLLPEQAVVELRTD